ncbi:MAG: hypothetical protein PVF83_18890 [Anaerolineales bacterium]|jgi:hypothetical protein
MSEDTLNRKVYSKTGKPKRARLNQHLIDLINAALGSLGSFGEVRLVVQKGVLRYIVTQNSIDALKCSPDDFQNKDSEIIYER